MKTLKIDNVPAPRLPGMLWRKTGYPYMIRSDGRNLNTLTTDCTNLTDARRRARVLAKRSGWSEIFRWSENGVMIKPVFIASYDWNEE